MKRFVAFISLALLLAGCDTATDPEAQVMPGLGPPIATGLFLMNEDASALGDWRNPTEGGLRTYPNPSSGLCVFQFNMERSEHVRCWAVAALPPEEASEQPTAQVAGGMVLVGGNAPVAVILDAQLQAGTNQVAWNMGIPNSAGQYLPTGFYRVYVQIGDRLLYNDHFGQVGDDLWLPAGLDHMMPW
jgi:hypothetical protein